MLRRHPTPAPEKFTSLLKAANQAGFEMDVSSSKALADSLDRATGGFVNYVEPGQARAGMHWLFPPLFLTPHAALVALFCFSGRISYV